MIRTTHDSLKTSLYRLSALLSAAVMAIAMTPASALAGGDISNFTVRNCTSQRIFVCSFDKTDSLQTIPYKARGIQPADKKEFGCASIGRCKVIIGVTKKKSKKTLSAGMESALSTASGASAVVAVGSGGLFVATGMMAVEATGATAVAVVGTAGGALVALGAGAAVASIEIADGWSDGKVCSQVKKAAQRLNLKPKHYLQDGKHYQVIEKYAATKDGNPVVDAAGYTAFAYTTQRKKGSCSASLPEVRLIKD